MLNNINNRPNQAAEDLQEQAAEIQTQLNSFIDQMAQLRANVEVAQAAVEAAEATAQAAEAEQANTEVAQAAVEAAQESAQAAITNMSEYDEVFGQEAADHLKNQEQLYVDDYVNEKTGIIRRMIDVGFLKRFESYPGNSINKELNIFQTEAEKLTNSLIHWNDGKLTVDVYQLLTHRETIQKVLESSLVIMNTAISTISVGLLYRAVMRVYTLSAYGRSQAALSRTERLFREQTTRSFAIYAAPSIVIFLAVAIKCKTLIRPTIPSTISSTITSTISSSNPTQASFWGLGLFKSSFARFLVITFMILVITQRYFPNVLPFLESFINDISIQSLLKFNILWTLVFIFYYLIQLYFANNIVPTNISDKIIPNFKSPRYLPGYIKTDFELLYGLVQENKDKAMSSLIRILILYLSILFLLLFLSILV